MATHPSGRLSALWAASAAINRTLGVGVSGSDATKARRSKDERARSAVRMIMSFRHGGVGAIHISTLDRQGGGLATQRVQEHH